MITNLSLWPTGHLASYLKVQMLFTLKLKLYSLGTNLRLIFSHPSFPWSPFYHKAQKRSQWETMHDSKWDFGDQSCSIVIESLKKIVKQHHIAVPVLPEVNPVIDSELTPRSMSGNVIEAFVSIFQGPILFWMFYQWYCHIISLEDISIDVHIHILLFIKSLGIKTCIEALILMNFHNMLQVTE